MYIIFLLLLIIIIIFIIILLLLLLISWDMHKRSYWILVGKINQLLKDISNRNVNLSSLRLLLLSVIRRMEVRCGKVIRVRQVLWNS